MSEHTVKVLTVLCFEVERNRCRRFVLC